MLFLSALSLASVALASPIGLGSSLFTRQTQCASAAPSCPSDPNADTCCNNSPGGYLALTMLWDANPSTGPQNSFTIHGLWPDHCDGTYDATCDPDRQYTDIAGILQQNGGQSTLDYMSTYWKDLNGNDEHFWEHEWGKHGTCVSTLAPSCISNYQPQQEVLPFFNATVSLFQSIPLYDWLNAAGIVPDSSATYALADLQAVVNNQWGADATWSCKRGALDQVSFGFTSIGSLADGNFSPTGTVGRGSNCPQQGIQWLPKQ